VEPARESRRRVGTWAKYLLKSSPAGKRLRDGSAVGQLTTWISKHCRYGVPVHTAHGDVYGRTALVVMILSFIMTGSLNLVLWACTVSIGVFRQA
jgi:hypothetical protein